MNVREIWRLIKQTIKEWQEDKASRYAAALAYYTVFSLGPLLLIVIVLVGAVWGQDAARGQVYQQLRDTAGEDTARAIQDLIQNLNESQSSGLAAVIGIVGLVVGATSIITQLQDSLNSIWGVELQSEGGIVGMIKGRGMAFLLIIGLGGLLLLSLVSDTVLNGLAGEISDLLPSAAYLVLLQVLNIVVFLGLLALAFAMVYKVLPAVDLSWSDVGVGALVTAVLFVIGRYAISLYLARSSTTSAYGAAGSFILILVWVYYSAQIFFVGAEFTQVYARRHGKLIRPSENAQPAANNPANAAGKPGSGAQEQGAQEKKEGRKPTSRKSLTQVAVTAVLAFVVGAVAGFFGDKDSAEIDA
ncbi:YihY/virulence factor BrkB family protein [Aggregatilinea lenta]|uniref:YihY/virulence factor BrkB family protein n=1 Tax=Aggregatilinea lenta TaxID=913108 RepID=UPI000E5BE4B4|nr:YihY/virulence factor BrkB family protein [Aggregatilinea lenta]